MKKYMFYIFFAILFLIIMGGCCFQSKDYHLNDNGAILWEGTFPHDFNEKDQIERKPSTLTKVSHNDHLHGTIETRDKNLKLVYISKEGKETDIWSYVDYSWINKVTYDNDEKTIRLYFERSLLGLMKNSYLLEFNIETLRQNKVTLRCGIWSL